MHAILRDTCDLSRLVHTAYFSQCAQVAQQCLKSQQMLDLCTLFSMRARLHVPRNRHEQGPRLSCHTIPSLFDISREESHPRRAFGSTATTYVRKPDFQVTINLNDDEVAYLKCEEQRREHPFK